METIKGNGKKSVKAFYPLMIVPGIVLLLAPSTVETIMKNFNFREALGGLLQVAYFVGGVVGILLITWFMQRFDTKQIVVSQVLVLAVFLLLSAVSPWYPLMLVFFTFAGFANGILIAFPGVYITKVRGESSHEAQVILYGFFSLGVLLGPLLAGLMIDNGVSWRWVYALPALLVIPLSLPVILSKLERIENVERLSRDVLRKVSKFNGSLFYGLLIALLLYIAAESAVSMWLVTFFEEQHGVGGAGAHWILTGLWAGLTLGRWVCGYAARRISPFKILVFLTVSSGILVLVAPLLGSKVGAMVLYPLIGVFYSGIYPFLIGYVAWFPSEHSSAVFTLFLAAGAVGGATLPYLVGLVNQFAGLAAGMSIIALPVFGVLACLYRIRTQVSEGPPVSVEMEVI